MKNIYTYTKTINKNRMKKLALSMRMEDKSIRTYTFSEMYTAADQLANKLTRAMIAKKDRVAIVAACSPEWIISYLALAKLGVTSALIDSSLEASEIKRLIEKSNVSGIITDFKNEDKIPVNKHIPIFNMMKAGDLCESSLTSKCQKKYFDGNETIASIIFSSGTTRSAAGIMHTHDALIDSAQMCINANGLNEKDRYLAILPNSHIYGVICQMMGPLLTGADVCFLDILSANNLISAFSEYRPTIFPSVPKIYDMLKTQIMKKINAKPSTRKLYAKLFPVCLKLRKKYNINIGKIVFKSIQDGFGGCIKVLCSAGAPISSETADFFYGTGFNLLITYGATETNIPTIGNYGRRLTTDSIGIPYKDVSIRITDSGELQIKSNYMMKGYYGDPELTKDAFTKDGWFKSGDLVFADSKRHIHITGRLKENIVLRSGKKVAPDDIESAYMGIDGAEELIVCGIPSVDGAGDEVHIFIKAQEVFQTKILEQLSAKKASLSKMFAYNKVHFLDSIPKTTLQKPKRYLLQQYAANLSNNEVSDQNKCNKTP